MIPKSSLYEQVRARTTIVEVAALLGFKPSTDTESEQRGVAICHTGGDNPSSLRIDKTTGSWKCFACGKGGDLFHLIEAARFGTATKGAGRSANRSQALLAACEMVGIATSEYRVPGSAIPLEDPAIVALDQVVSAATEELLQRSDVLEWVRAKWGFDEEDIARFRLGFIPPDEESALSPGWWNWLRDKEIYSALVRASLVRKIKVEGQENVARRTYAQAGRIIFPYHDGGTVVYSIGRLTPWTPAALLGTDPSKPNKYHKLRVYGQNDSTRAHISPVVHNERLWGDEALRYKQRRILVIEGIADAHAAVRAGAAAVSPITIRLSAAQRARFFERLHASEVDVVDIAFDSEASSRGEGGALELAVELLREGFRVNVVSVPATAEMERVRVALAELLGASAVDAAFAVTGEARVQMLYGSAQDSGVAREDVARLLATGKVDLADYLAGRSPEEAAEMLVAIRIRGRHPLEVQVEHIAALAALDPEITPQDRLDAFASVIDTLARMRSTLWDEVPRAIAEACGRGVTVRTVRDRIAEHRKREKITAGAKPRGAKPEPDPLLAAPPITAAPPPTRPGAPPPPPGKPTDGMAQVIASRSATLTRMIDDEDPPRAIGTFGAETARLAGLLAYSYAGQLTLVLEGRPIIYADAITRPLRDLFYRVFGLSLSRNQKYKSAAEAILTELEHGAKRSPAPLTWSVAQGSGADVRVFLALGGPRNVAVEMHGGRAQVHYVTPTSSLPPMRPADIESFGHFQLGFLEKANQLEAIRDEFVRRMPFARESGMFVFYWLAAAPIIEAVDRRPILRIEGKPSDGKSTATETIIGLALGLPSVPRMTEAALRECAQYRPLVAMDNIEQRQAERFEETVLSAHQRGTYQKMGGANYSSTLSQRFSALLLTNGVESISGGAAETVSRYAVVRCSSEHFDGDGSGTSEGALEWAISRHEAFWSGTLRRCATALVLAADRSEVLIPQIRALMTRSGRGRWAEYALRMVAIWAAGEPDPEAAMVSLPDWFVRAARRLDELGTWEMVSSAPSVTFLRYAFAGLRLAERTESAEERARLFGAGRPDRLDGRFAVYPDGSAGIAEVSVRQLMHYARGYCRSVGIHYPERIDRLEARIPAEVTWITEAGYGVERIYTSNRGVVRFEALFEDVGVGIGLGDEGPPRPAAGIPKRIDIPSWTE